MSHKERKHLYEGMYIISATLSDEARSKALDRIQQEIISRGGEVFKVHEQNRKRLAYDIEGHREGHYFILYFEIDPSMITEIWHEYHLHEDLIRFMMTRTDKVMEKIEFKPLVAQE